MITISRPIICKNGGRAILSALVKDENRCVEKELWYSVPDKCEGFLCADYADAFLVALILLAMRTSQDITCESPVSKKLLFNVCNTLQPIFSHVISNGTCVNISAPAGDVIKYQRHGIGCGCSLGVDALSAYYAQNENCVSDDYKVTHLALFNCGQLGDYEHDKVTEYFKRSIAETVPFANEVGLPLVDVDSNINEFYKNSGVTLLQSFVLRTISCAMALQKGWGYYVYGSSYPITNFSFSDWDASHMESSYVPLLETENFTPILANPMMSRVEKTDYIAKHELTQKYLRVCWAEQTAYEVWHNTKYLDGKIKVNCGWCDKCLRTLFTLEALGYDLAPYASQFDLERYKEHREEFLINVIQQRDINVFYKEIFELIEKRSIKLPDSALKILKRQRNIASINSLVKGAVRRLSRRLGISWL